ncbi:staphylococcal nuclease domain-containing protein 1 [Orussus abietinus]|uniref:staphylococcal nuclease domain-containing protein 1 n=1 Tax=Orussus abietinus TaxID=222816 RepID=UPI000625197C|nr:staphylococcal nuclease domain-containing protein 1 [Orussus abietinus]
MTTPQVQMHRGTVKEVFSGDQVVVRARLQVGGPPPEKHVILSNVIAPKLARKVAGSLNEQKDEPYAWEAREYLRKKLIGQHVTFTLEKSTNNNKWYGVIYLPKDGNNKENITESLVSEGLVSVKRDGIRNPSPELIKLQELEDAAKTAGKGKWSNSPASNHIRSITWTIENHQALVDKLGRKPVKAIIERVLDGSTVRAFLLPEFYNVTLMISGIRCPHLKREGHSDPSEPYAEEAQYFVEIRLLQRDVEIVLESVSNNNFIGSIIHPKGNIAEALLHEGFAECVPWSMNHVRSGAEKLYQAQKSAQEKGLRRWKDYVPSSPHADFSGTVVEIASADSLIVRTNAGETKKVFLSSIRPPRERKPEPGEDGKPVPRPKDFRPLYDIPWMFEAREFLRKKLIRKPVRVTVDYIQPARDNFPEKLCCTVTSGKVNIAEAMVSKGLATVVRYRQNDDQRSSHYSELLAAENKAEKSQHGVHARKDVPTHRIPDLSLDPAKAKNHQAALKRARGTKAIVEFVMSGSRLKLFVPKESCLITFLLAGVKAPRGPRPAPGGQGALLEGEPYGEEALAFTREHCLQRDVEIQVEGMDARGANFIGWLFVDGVNISVALVEEGLAEVPGFTEQGEYYKTLKAAEERARVRKLNIWKDRVPVEPEVEKVEEERQVVERKIDYQEVVVSEIGENLHFYAQSVGQRGMLESLQSRLRQELGNNPPLPGAYVPKRGDLAVAKFVDDQWYRAKVERVAKNNVSVFYVDYGNREIVDAGRVAALPTGFAADKPFASEYVLACVSLHTDNDDKKLATEMLQRDVEDRTLLLNVEYKVNNIPAATLVDASTKEDIAKGLVLDGYLIVAHIRDRKLEKLVKEYQEAEEDAKNNHRNIWRYGDIREDTAKEFGIGP